MTAYIRVLGGTLTGSQSFIGPMAKQHRMAVLTVASLGSIAEVWLRHDGRTAQEVMRAALVDDRGRLHRHLLAAGGR